MIDDRTDHYDLPLPAASNTLNEDVGRLRSALSGLDAAVFVIDQQTNESSYSASGMSASLTFQSSGALASMSEILSNGDVRVTSFGYDLEGVLTSVRVDLGATRRTTTYTYHASGLLTGWETTEVAL